MCIEERISKLAELVGNLMIGKHIEYGEGWPELPNGLVVESFGSIVNLSTGERVSVFDVKGIKQ